jgi:hypothetical protein
MRRPRASWSSPGRLGDRKWAAARNVPCGRRQGCEPEPEVMVCCYPLVAVSPSADARLAGLPHRERAWSTCNRFR